MLPTTMKKLLIVTSLSCGVLACDGSDTNNNNPTATSTNNQAPTVAEFTASVDPSAPLVYTYSWSVSDPDGDTLTCTLNPGDGQQTPIINDCANNNSIEITYESAGDFTPSFRANDNENAYATADIDISVSTGIVMPDPVIVASANQLVVFYNRPDNTYTDWVLHLWNNSDCEAYADFAIDGGTDWNTGQAQTGIDPNYGAYWVLDLKDSYGECANFIVHKGDEKDLGGGDLRADLTGERTFWTLSGKSFLYNQPTLFPKGAQIEDIAAHWANVNTMYWNVPAANTAKVRIYSSASDDMGFDSAAGIDGDNYIEYMPDMSETHPATTLGMPRYSGQAAFTTSNANDTKAKQMLMGKLLAIAYDVTDKPIAATHVQTPRILDALYTSGMMDADEAELGLVYDGNDIISNLWAPTAQSVILNVFNADKILQTSHEMSLNTDTGIWSFSVPNTVDRSFYRFELTLYHPQNHRFETVHVTDPYSVSLSTNGMYSQFVNLTDSDLMPTGWEEHMIPTVMDPEDAIIYEGHIRDFSVRDASTSEINRGKYLAFTEESSVPVTHLKSLVAAGLTHFQMLPANDIASINEDSSTRVNITDTVADLCAHNSSAPVCGVEDNAATLLSVFESYDANSNDAQALLQAMRKLDSFNWGYDPKHYTTPEGSYASNSDGATRILEMRQMNQALHEMGLRVVLDVVYNHTNSSGLFDDSVLDKVVPGYYHRRDLVSGNVITDTCCQDTAPEHKMMDKLMSDSLMTWTQAYKFDGFRFDIMSNNSVDSILNARARVQTVDADNYFYGEGWTRADQGYIQAQQNNMAGTEVATFNDRSRDIIRGGDLFNGSSNLNNLDIIRLGLAGTLENYELQDKNGIKKLGKNFSQSAYAKDPADVINYVSKHDNETLWDQLQYGLASDMSVSNRVRAQNIAATLPLISQGIPFFQLGGDFIRSKSMDRNTYDAGDWFNYVDFTKSTNNWNVGLPLAEDNKTKWEDISGLISNSESSVQSSDIEMASMVFNEFLSIRKASKLFRLTSEADVLQRVGFHNTGSSQTQGLIVMSIDDGLGLTDLDANNDAIVVIVNGSPQEQSHTVATADGFELHAVQQNSADSTVQMASFIADIDSGTFTVPALTTAVFVKPQGDMQSTGLAADATSNQPDVAPYGDVVVYLRGSMNNWGNDGLTEADSFVYEGNNTYSLDVTLSAGQQTFKIASNDWSAVNLGYNEMTYAADSVTVSDDGGNLTFNVASDSLYTFTLDASTTTPVLGIVAKSETVDCTALIDSADPAPFTIAGSGQLYVRGSHSGWNAEADYQLHYKGDNKYQAVANFDGEFQFKLASDDGSWTTQLWAQAPGTTDLNAESLDLGVSYAVAYDDGGLGNNQANLAAGQYSILLTLNSENPSNGFDIGSMIIQQCQTE
ncbi:alpha-1,6-glucosidase domain-containing protein [Thalassotalea fonticola]|uniref:Alpha-1,6-glucosidase domain-containing protein n=1 Tax=Thalassotalea fonticola TaxID=3065649 RepID=A0ABZ0GKA4_9GAMM|nr:alpha-1,6-glucosidase domain-containing protein [Colwelliaceae bacterium S1-1]